MSKYQSTLLAQTNEPTEIQKADLDLLNKINDQANTIESMQKQIDSLTSGSSNFVTWKPYPSGVYSFPSGDQAVAEGVLAIGATTTAPTFGTGTTKFAWFRDWGKTIDIMFAIQQTTVTGANNGSGNYLAPLPLGKVLDTNYIQFGSTSNSVVGTAFSGITFRGFANPNTYFSNHFLTPVTTTSFIFNSLYTGSTGAAGVAQWSSTQFGIAAYAQITVSGIVTGIPVA